MRVTEPEMVDTVWTGIKGLLPDHVDRHPLGCHRRRASDRDCFEVMFVRHVTGCSWEDAERLCANKVSDTTVRPRRDEWVAAGVFDQLADEAIRAYDKIVGLDLSEVAVDGSLHKSPAGGEGTGKNPTDRGKLGWKWSVLTDANGIPPDRRGCQPQRLGAPRADRDAAERGCSTTSRPSGSTGATTPTSRGSDCAISASKTPSSPRARGARREQGEEPPTHGHALAS